MHLRENIYELIKYISGTFENSTSRRFNSLAVGRLIESEEFLRGIRHERKKIYFFMFIACRFTAGM